MKNISLLFLALSISLPSFSGKMEEARPNHGYVFVSGGIYDGDFESDFIRHENGVLTERSSFNNQYDNGYGQIGLGYTAMIDTFIFNNEISLSKFFDSFQLKTSSNRWRFNQRVDVGYDVLPVIPLLPRLNAFALIGGHYGSFTYRRDGRDGTIFNIVRNQLGLALGAGLRFKVSDALSLGLKYQHLQYAAIDASGISAGGTRADNNRIKPAFNVYAAQIVYAFG